MRRLSALILLGIVTVGCCAPVLANTSPRAQARADRKAEKKQQKAQRKYARKQKKAERKMLKTERKNSTYKPTKRF